MREPLVLTIDFGTQSVRAMLFDKHGKDYGKEKVHFKQLKGNRLGRADSRVLLGQAQRSDARSQSAMRRPLGRYKSSCRHDDKRHRSHRRQRRQTPSRHHTLARPKRSQGRRQVKIRRRFQITSSSYKHVRHGGGAMQNVRLQLGA